MKLSDRSLIVATPTSEELKIQIIKPVQPAANPKNDYSDLGLVLNILLGVFEVAAAVLTDGLSVGAQLGINAIFTAVEIGTNIGIAKLEDKKLDIWDFALPILSFGIGESVLVNVARNARKISRVEQAVRSNLLLEGLNDSQARIIDEQLRVALTGPANANDVVNNLKRVGITDKQVSKSLQIYREEIAKVGLKDQGFFNELDFNNKETDVWSTAFSDFDKAGIDVNNFLKTLQKEKIDVTSIRNTADLVKTIKRSPEVRRALRSEDTLETIEEVLDTKLEPSFALQIINARNIERAVRQSNKALKLVNPNRFVKRIVDKVFDPVKHQIDERVWKTLSKKSKQKLKQFIRQDYEKNNKNGVYPCFGSGWINYLRAVPYGNGYFKCFVIFRKRGYQPVLITPPLKLQDIVDWSQQFSPGKTYHKFRKKYAGPKGVSVSTSEFGTDTLRIFNSLGFIPSKYINLGTSLLGNIMTAYTVLSTNKWTTFNFSDAFRHEIIDGVAESIGGRFGKSVAGQYINGDHLAIRNYVFGKGKASIRKNGGESFRKKKKERAAARSLYKIKNVKNKF